MEAAAFTAASYVQDLGFAFTPSDFTAECSEDGAGTWSCFVDSGQCSGTVDVYFRGHEYLEAQGTDARIGCAE